MKNGGCVRSAALSIFSENPVNQPVKAIPQFFREPVRQSHQYFLEPFILEKGIQQGIAGNGFPFRPSREKGPDKERTGMLLKIAEIVVYFSFELPGFLP